MTNKISLLIYIFIILLAAGCATLQTDYEEPSVVITDFRSIPSGGIAPRFEIGLHIVNPNRTALHLKGISYTVKLEGHKVLTGVSNKLPVIDAYGEGDVKLAATADLFGSISLQTDMIQNKRNAFRYVLDVKMDTGGLLPDIRVRKEGNISLAPQ
jgi:hypothetical protein